LKYNLSVKKLLLLLLLSLGLIACSEKEPELDYSISNGKFYTSEGEIPIGCFAQLMTELNGDNSVASIYLNRNSMRGCIDANILNPSAYAQSFFESSYEEEITYTIEKKLDNHQYRLKVCRIVDTSMGSYCDKIIVQFSNRDYVKAGFDLKNVLVLDKLGEWS
jgi:hypothetical protein